MFSLPVAISMCIHGFILMIPLSKTILKSDCLSQIFSFFTKSARN